MNIKSNIYKLFFKLFLSIIFFLLTSLFFSAQKILIVLIISIIFFLIKTKYQKLIIMNLVIFVFLFKIILYPFHKKIPKIDPSKKIIYEKHFLYGVKNLNFTTDFYNGDLSFLDNKFKEKYFRENNPKKIKIITDNLGFRNEIKPDKANYILIGDSFLHSTNISQNQIINYVLNNKYKLKTYNAGLGATDISHYFQTIKFFKKKMKLKNKKYIMFVFQGNDFLNYNINDNNNYHKYIDNILLNTYFNFKTFFNFYHSCKFFLHSLKKQDNNLFIVNEFSMNEKNILFKSDYIYSNNYNVSSLYNIFKKNLEDLPNLIIFIPTKYEVYCDLIENKLCKNSIHFLKLKSNPVLINTKVLDSTDFLKKEAKILFNKKKLLLYEDDDTHLNELGISTLTKFVFENINN